MAKCLKNQNVLVECTYVGKISTTSYTYVRNVSKTSCICVGIGIYPSEICPFVTSNSVIDFLFQIYLSFGLWETHKCLNDILTKFFTAIVGRILS